MITNTRTVLHRNPQLTLDAALDVDRVPFQTDVDEDTGRFYFFHIERGVWTAMGSPEFVTLSIEPGDTLNTVENIEACWAKGIDHPGTNALGEVVATR